jgi:hypothetical protein
MIKLDVIQLLNKENKRDSFGASVAIDSYIRHANKHQSVKINPFSSRYGKLLLSKIYFNLKKSNLEKRKKMILNDNVFKNLQAEVYYNKEFFVMNILLMRNIEDGMALFEIHSTTYKIKEREVVNTEPVGFVHVSIHSLERFIERAKNNSLTNLLSEIKLLIKVKMLCTYISRTSRVDCNICDMATSTGVWMGDVDTGLKTFVDKENLHSFDMGYLNNKEKNNIEDAFKEYTYLTSKSMKSYAAETVETLSHSAMLSFMKEIGVRYDLCDYFTNWNTEKEKRLRKREQYCYSV